MLQEIRNYNNLGTINFFLELFSLFLKNKSWKVNDIKTHFFNRVIDNQYIFDGGVPFLVQLGILIENNDYISVNPEHIQICSLNSENLKKYLTKIIINNVLFDDYFTHIFSPGFITIDNKNSNILIENNAFELRYSNIKQLLINLDFIKNSSGFNFKYYRINKSYNKLIIKNGLAKKAKRLFDIKQLEQQLISNEIHGREAEEFVLMFEKNRLGQNKKIIQISEIDVCAGFDILSFHNDTDNKPNRFIEVKSYSGNPYFYWSKNEIEKAKMNQDDYFLYLINREQFSNEDYTPLIIKNPYVNVFKSENWMKDIQSYFVSKI